MSCSLQMQRPRHSIYMYRSLKLAHGNISLATTLAWALPRAHLTRSLIPAGFCSTNHLPMDVLNFLPSPHSPSYSPPPSHKHKVVVITSTKNPLAPYGPNLCSTPKALALADRCLQGRAWPVGGRRMPALIWLLDCPCWRWDWDVRLCQV